MNCRTIYSASNYFIWREVSTVHLFYRSISLAIALTLDHDATILPAPRENHPQIKTEKSKWHLSERDYSNEEVRAQLISHYSNDTISHCAVPFPFNGNNWKRCNLHSSLVFVLLSCLYNPSLHQILHLCPAILLPTNLLLCYVNANTIRNLFQFHHCLLYHFFKNHPSRFQYGNNYNAQLSVEERTKQTQEEKYENRIFFLSTNRRDRHQSTRFSS